MPIADSNDERRNLVLTSSSIIVFYLSGGSFPENSISLQVINVEFSKPEVLAYTIWTMLAWFTLRYWQMNKNLVSGHYRNGVDNLKRTKPVKRYIEKVQNVGHIKNRTTVIDNLDWSNRKLSFIGHALIYTDETKRKKTKIIDWTCDVKGIRGVILKVNLFCRMSIVSHEMGSFLVPYILAALATFLGFYF